MKLNFRKMKRKASYMNALKLSSEMWSEIHEHSDKIVIDGLTFQTGFQTETDYFGKVVSDVPYFEISSVSDVRGATTVTAHIDEYLIRGNENEIGILDEKTLNDLYEEA